MRRVPLLTTAWFAIACGCSEPPAPATEPEIPVAADPSDLDYLEGCWALVSFECSQGKILLTDGSQPGFVYRIGRGCWKCGPEMPSGRVSGNSRPARTDEL